MKLNNSIFLILIFSLLYNLSADDSTITDPDPGRFQNEIDTFIKWDEKNSFPEDAILFAGSSSIRMWKTHTAFPNFPVINRGFGGAHISDVIFYYDEIILKYNPLLIVFYCGDNDIAGDKPVEQVFEDYRELTVKIEKDLPDVKFIFLAVKPSGSRLIWWDKMQELNKRIGKYNQQKDNLFYVDSATPLLNSEGLPDNNLFFDDQLHLNDRGYELWHSILYKLLNSNKKP